MAEQHDRPEARVRLRSSADLAAVLPTVLGFKPENSLVALCIDSSNVVVKAMRIDMPDTGADARYVAELVGHHVGVEQCPAAALIAVTGDDLVARRIVSMVGARLGDTTVAAALRVDGDRYWNLSEPVAEEGRLIGRGGPVAEAAAIEVFHGRPTFASREEMAAIFAPADAGLRRQTNKAVEAVIDRFESAQRDRGLQAAVDGLCAAASRTLDDTVCDLGSFTPNTAGVLAFAAAINPVRDALMGRIDRAHAHEHVEVWRLTATHSTGRWSVAPYTLAAFASWLSGDGGKALVALEHARDIDPEYSLARLTGTAVVNGVHPAVGWQVVENDGMGR